MTLTFRAERCSLAPLVLRVASHNAEMMFTRLCTKLVSENSKEGEREISSIALKTLIQEVKTAAVRSQFVEVVTPHLLQGLHNCKKVRTARRYPFKAKFFLLMLGSERQHR